MLPGWRWKMLLAGAILGGWSVAAAQAGGARGSEATQQAIEIPPAVLSYLDLHHIITNYADLNDWLRNYREIGRTEHTIVYKLLP